MSVKTTGAEFKRFYSDDTFWPVGQDVWHEDESVTVGDEDWSEDHDYNSMPDDAAVRLDGGIVIGLTGNDEPSLEAYFKRWRKKQNTASFLVECDASKLDAIKAAIKAAGGKCS